jgi:hypothetical protein
MPSAPAVSARRTAGGLTVAYDTQGAPPQALVVAVRPAGAQEPAKTYPVAIDTPTGEVTVPDGAAAGGPLEVSVSSAHGRVSSPAATTTVG